MAGMIDLHCHILWNTDDGAETPSESLAIVQGLMELGFKGAAPSPHASVPGDLAKSRLEELKNLLAQRNMDFELHRNAESMLSPEEIARVLSGKTTMVDSTRFFLMELPHMAPVPVLTNILRMVAKSGRRMIIAHPERCFHFQNDPSAAGMAVKEGALLQLDLMSLSAAYGRHVERVARAILGEGLYSLAATDIHGSADLRAVEMSLSLLENYGDAAIARRLLSSNPRRILANQEPLAK